MAGLSFPAEICVDTPVLFFSADNGDIIAGLEYKIAIDDIEKGEISPEGP
jgi:phage-related minor tail protein